MKMKYLLLGLLLMAPLWIIAEEQEGAPSRTIEDLFLSQDIELQILRSQALGTDPEMKRLALRSIRAMVEQGAASDGVYVVLEALASEGVSRQVRSQGSIVNNFPLIRREATELLGQVGGERAKNTLLRVLRDDPEVVVLAEAAYALGSIGLNDNREVSDYLVHTLLRENARATPDNNLAYSIIISLERLSDANGGLADPEVLNALIETASSPYIRTVRMRAVDAIVNMRDHGR
ncbi:HEAT repeat-containing protein [Alkalispirochaeta americana]|uniref:HEAT repeat-containing protein n=1 Tax=Alkalispirochaeta americana TaxID=159291 RepID=A0A1N6QUH6_9SPIO|nr:HEAT repeat domain-containing protein [Alkalispirochaeta americana]SIQ20274.1 HEAT repeat-containing protein [Alkalispirochaeta americana]